MKLNQWTVGLAAAGVVSLGSIAQADEAQVLTALSSTTLSGYVNTSAHWNPGRGWAGAYSYGGGGLEGYKGDGFNLDVVQLTLQKPLDEGQWSAGYKVDVLFGPDANGLGTTSTFAPISDFAVKQAYVALRAPLGNGLDFKMGVFDTIIGYEVFEAGNNPNYTRSWGYTIEPTQHTGVLASYRFSDLISASFGIANTRDAVINARSPRAQDHKTYMAALTLTAPEEFGMFKGATVTMGAVEGINSTGPAGGPDVTNLYLGMTIPTPLEGLALGASLDYLVDSSAQDATAVALYASFQATEKLKLNSRVEYFSPGTSAYTVPISPEIGTVTLTADYALWSNVLTRVEWRWDHDLSGGANLPGQALSAGGGAYNNAHLLALNVIYKF